MPNGSLDPVRYRLKKLSLDGCYTGPCIATTSLLLLIPDESARC